MKKSLRFTLSVLLVTGIFSVLLCGCNLTPLLDSTGTPSVISGLTLNTTKIELKVGESETLSVTDGEDGENYSFRSDSAAVSVNDQGVVVGKEIGSACVIVTSTTGKKAVCVVIVTDTMPIKLNALEISGASETIRVGEVVQLYCEKEPIDADSYNSIRWYSENEEVASINKDGLLTAGKIGTTVITVKATGTEIFARFTINVIARQSTLSFEFDDATGILGTNDLVLNANLFTDYEDVTVEGYRSDNESVATVNENGEVSFHSVGKAVISYALTCGGERLETSCKVAVIEKEGYTVIRTPKQLQDIGNKSGNYMLGNDIDMKDACSQGGSSWFAGQGFSPLFNKKAEAFSGTFDGMGYSIKNLYINRPESHFVALFGYINVNEGSEGVICNLGLEGGRIEGANYVSSFIAYHNGSGSINAGLKNCWTNIEIIAHGKSCGGLVAYNGGMIENCYSLSKISGTGTLCSVSYNVIDDDSLGVKEVFICKDYQLNIENLVNPDYAYGTVREAQYKSLQEMKSPDLYSKWDHSVWSIQEDSLPVLKTENDR